MGAGAAQSDNARFGKRGREPVAEQGHLIGERHLVERQVIGMDMHVPEAGHQIPAFEIDHLRVAGAARLSAWQDGADAAILDQHGAIRPYLGLDAVDQVRMRKDCLHGGRLLGLISEIPSSTAAPKRRSTSAASEDWRRPRLPTKQPRVGRAPRQEGGGPRDRLKARDHSSLARCWRKLHSNLLVSLSAGWFPGVWIPPRSFRCRPAGIRVARLALCCHE